MSTQPPISPTRGRGGLSSTIAAAPAELQPDTTLARFQQLQAQRATLEHRRTRVQVELEGAEREAQQCLLAAQAYGVSTPEELQALILREQAEDQARLDVFERQLKEEEELLNSIAQTLETIGATPA